VVEESSGRLFRRGWIPLAFRPFSLRPGPLFPLKKLLKKFTPPTAEIRYENRVQFLWRTAQNIEDLG
jgi:hypothetical protein